jgi:hypothetical protein
VGRRRAFVNLQAACKPSRLVFDDGWFWRFAHDDQLLVRHHDYTRELREPDANMHETLQHTSNLNMSDTERNTKASSCLALCHE